jgi:uncharacterized alkaline shock family protein YloU
MNNESMNKGVLMETKPKIGKITIAPEVLETTARLTTLAVPGVARLTSPPGMQRLLRHDGVKIKVTGNSVQVNLYVVAEPDVTRAIQDMIGMQVQSVDVHVEDVSRFSEEA